MSISSYNQKVIAGGVVAALVTSLGTFLIGNLSGYQAKQLIESSLPGVNTFFNTIVLPSATILALLLTLLSLSRGSQSKLKKDHYLYVLSIAKLVTIVFVSSIISFLLLNLPITEAEDVPYQWFQYIYYISIGLASLHCGAIIAVVLMLYNTISDIINIGGLHQEDDPLAFQDENDIEDNSDS